MRRVISIAIAAALVLGAFTATAAEAKKRRKRVVRKAEATYDTPAIGVGGVAGLCSGANGCAALPVAANERFISVVVEDSSGTSVYARVTQDTNGDGQADSATPFCGTSGGKIPIEPGIAVNVFVYAAGVLPAPCPGVATSGVVKATFTN